MQDEIEREPFYSDKPNEMVGGLEVVRTTKLYDCYDEFVATLRKLIEREVEV